MRIVEQRHDPPSMERGSRGTAYQPRTLEVFDDLGVLDQALADAWTDMPTRIYRNGALVADLSKTAGERPSTPEVPYPTMARPLQTWRVEEMLCHRLNALGAKVEMGRRLVGLEQDELGVTAWIQPSEPMTEGWGRAASTRADADEAGGEAPAVAVGADAERIRVQYVVGCDGGHSAVRKLAGLAYESRRRLGFAGMIADLHVDGIEPTYMRMWFGPDGGEVVLSPQPTTGNFQFIAQMEPGPDGNYPEPTIELAQRLFDERARLPGVRLHDITWKSFFKVRESLVDHFRAGRVFIGGDAAHLHSPAGGLGANSGIQDAYNLGWKLAYVVKGHAPPSLLDTYETERRPVAEDVLRSSGDQHVSLFARQALRGGVDPASASQSHRTIDWMSQLGIFYGDSALNGGSRGSSSPTVGDRAPDGRLIAVADGRRLRLFDVYRGDHFTLLLFGPSAALAQLGDQVGGRYRDRVRVALLKDIDDPAPRWTGTSYVDPHGRARTAYHGDERPIALVRPDGYLAFRGEADDGPELLDHLAAILLAP